MSLAAAFCISLMAVSGGRSRGLSPETAEMVIYCVAGAGGLVWMLTLLGWARLSSVRPGESEETDPQGGTRLIYTKVRVVSGEPIDVADGLARALASPSWGAMPLLVKREGDGLLVAVSAGPASMRAVPCFSSCSVELRSLAAGQTEVAFRMDFAGARQRARRVAGVLLVLGLVAVILLPGLLYFLAASSSSATARFQVVQAVHVGHLLWPPWLIFAIHRRSRRATEMYLDAAANNASVLAEAFASKRIKGQASE